MILAIVSVVFSQLSVLFLGCFKCSSFARWLYDKVKIDKVSPVMILFMLEGYIDLLIGALINTENDYLFLVADNWGPYGHLNFSDQFSVLLGNFFYFACIIFPVVVFWALNKKSRGYVFMLKSE